MSDLIEVTQADRDAAADWTFIECMRCSEYEGDMETDLAADFAAHRTQAIATLTAENERLREALEDVCDCDHLHASHSIALKALKGQEQ